MDLQALRNSCAPVNKENVWQEMEYMGVGQICVSAVQGLRKLEAMVLQKLCPMKAFGEEVDYMQSYLRYISKNL